MFLVMSNGFSFEGMNNGKSLKLFNRINCGDNVTCSRTGNGIFNIAIDETFRDQISITASPTTLASTACGSTVMNTASTPVLVNLPSADDNAGCRITFITTTATNFDINPLTAERIMLLTNADGDAIRNAKLGDNIILEAITVNTTPEWVTITASGNWADIN